MRVVICYDPPSVRMGGDIFERAEFVRESLLGLGHMVINVPNKKQPELTISEIKKYKPDVVWNLFESYHGRKDDVYMGAIMLDNSGVRYTGCSAQSILFCADKVITKQILRGAGANAPVAYAHGEPFVPGKWILKAKSMTGSDDIGGGKVIFATTERDLQNEILSMPLEYNIFAEQFIDGVEYSVFLLDKGDGLKTIAMGQQMPHIQNNRTQNLPFAHVSESTNTREDKTFINFNHTPGAQQIVQKIRMTADIIAPILDMKGYAKMSFRVDNKGAIWAADTVTNPMLSSTSAFVAACAFCGINNVKMADYIIKAALR